MNINLVSLKSLLLLLVMASCSQEKGMDMALEEADYDGEVVPVTRQDGNSSDMPVEATNSQEVIKKKIIKDGRLAIRVGDLGRSKSNVDTLVKSFNGYYANENYDNTDYRTSYYLTIRVPSQNFEKLIAAIEAGKGEIENKAIDARDVTSEFIDLETRLENKRNYLARYRELLKQAKSIKEILEVEEKIRVLEEEIESTMGRLKYLNDQVNYSTLNLTLTQQKDFKYSPVHRTAFFERLKQSLAKGWYGFIDFLLVMIRLWPFWIILGFVVYFWRKYRRKKK